MPLPNILEFIGTNITQRKFQQAQEKLLNYLGVEVPTKADLSNVSADLNAKITPKADKTYVDNALSGFTNGASKFYPTLALAEADIANITVEDKVDIGEVTNGGTWYKATTGATSLTKSAYDPLTQAKADATAKVNEVVQNTLFANLARISSNPSLIDFSQVITTRPSDGWSRILWEKKTEVLNTKGIFIAFKLEVVGAAYPTTYNDANVFAGNGMRLQAFDSVGLKYTRNLVNLPNTKIWYYFGSDTDTVLNVNDVVLIKAEFYAKAGVTLTISEPILYADNRLGNAEPMAREESINSKLTEFIESYLATATVDVNLLNATQGTSSSIVQLVTPITSPISRFSGLCIIETDGTYPTENSPTVGFRARIETETSVPVAGNAAFLKRIGNTKIWYVMNAPVVGADIAGVKIRANKPADGTYITIKNAIITDQGLPNPIQVLIKDAVDINEIKSELEPFIEQMVTYQIASLNVEQYPTTAFDAISRAATRRVDIVAFGDSNHYMNGYGFDYALRNALAARFGLYATPPLQGGNKFGVQTGFSLTQAEKVLAGVEPNYIAEGITVGGSGQQSLLVGNGAVVSKYLINPSSKLRCHFAYSTFASGSGNFRVGARQEASPYTTYTQSPVINTNTGAETYQLSQLDLEAGTRDNQTLGFRFAQVNQTLTGPFLSYFMRVEDVNKTNGVCFSSIYGRGGQSLWDMCSQAYTWSMQELTNYFSEIRRLQLSKNQSPLIVVYINSGLNDQNETSSPSWGWRESTDGKSATAYLDNLEALAKRVADVWQLNGWDETELFFWINPSHPTATPDAAKLKAFRKAAFTFAGSRARVSVVDFENLTSESELTANDWYREPTDHSHLKLAGYEALSQRIVDLVP